MTRKELESLLRNETKKANQRLKSLEDKKLQQFNAYQHTLNSFEKMDKAYRIKEGKVRFRGDFKNMSYNELVHLAKEVGNFNRSHTSTVRGIKKAYSKMTDSFNKKYKSDMSPEEMAKIWSSHEVQQFKKIYGSERIIKLIRKSKKGLSADDMINFMSNSNKNDITGSDLDYMIRYKLKGGSNPFENS